VHSKREEQHSKSQPGKDVLWEMAAGRMRPKGGLDVFQAKLQGWSSRSPPNVSSHKTGSFQKAPP